MVREIFRNLVTAQGTRAAADRAELLSVFGEKRDEAGAVLDALVDARLLTEYEAADAHPGQGPTTATHGEAPAAARNDAGHRRVEIVHESLLTHWPRLARWRTQDADGAQLRDQLRQAAHLWDERGRAGRPPVDRDVVPGLPRVAGPLRRRPVGPRRGVRAGHDGPRGAAEAPSADRRRGGRGRAGRSVSASSARSGRGARPRGGRRTPRPSRPKPASCSPWARPSWSGIPRRPSPMSPRAWSWPTPKRPGASPCACCRTRPTAFAAPASRPEPDSSRGVQPRWRVARPGRLAEGSAVSAATAASPSS